MLAWLLVPVAFAADCADVGPRLERMIDARIGERWVAWMPRAVTERVQPMTVDGTPVHSTPLRQHAAADEPVRLRTDGHHLFAIDQAGLVVTSTDPWRADGALSRVAVDGTPVGLHLADDRAVVVSRVRGRPSPRSGDAPRWTVPEATAVTVVDVSDPLEPAVVREIYASGRLDAARRVDDRLVLVTSQPIRKRPAVAGARGIRPSDDPTPWLPQRLDAAVQDGAWSVTTGVATCASTSAWERAEATGVHVLDLADPAAAPSSAVALGGTDAVYVDDEAVWLARDQLRDVDAPSTHLDGFTLSGEPLGAGVVAGGLPSAFGWGERRLGLSWHREHLRVVTHDGATRVTVLRPDDGDLREVGALTDLAPGEELMAARFDGDRLHASTVPLAPDPVRPELVPFVDPFLSIDLSDPADPRLDGELVVPGWSDLLQPIGKDRVLAAGTSLALFDVSDPFAPRQLATLDTSRADSDARDALAAWTWLAPARLLVVPTHGLGGGGVDVVRVHDDALERLDYLPTGTRPQGAVLVEGALWVATARGLLGKPLGEDGWTATFDWTDDATASAPVPLPDQRQDALAEGGDPLGAHPTHVVERPQADGPHVDDLP